jgi:phosphatidylglycerophosphate synthase
MGLRAEYTRGLKSAAVEELFDLVFYRPVAFLLVIAVHRRSVTPNQLTLLSMLFGIAGGVGLALGTGSAMAAAGVFFLLYNILDCSDGQLARMNGSGTHLGRILDGLSDYVTSLAAYLGIGIGFATPSDWPVLAWVLTAAAGFSNILQSLLLDFYRKRYLAALCGGTGVPVDDQHAWEEEYAALRRRDGKGIERTLIGVYLLYSRVQRHLAQGVEKAPQAMTPCEAERIRSQRILMHCWTYLGPTTQWTLLVVCSFIGRLDIYLWGIAGVGNLLVIIMSLAQRWSDRHAAAVEVT